MLLHFFGSDSSEWDTVRRRLGEGCTTQVMDLPGFGSAADAGAMDVAGMAHGMGEFIERTVQGSYVLVGHSMSGKVAMAHVASTDRPPLALILVAPSPPASEPMSAEARRKLLAFDGSHEAAAAYVDGNVALPLPDDVRERAIAAARAASPAAWRAWVESGSQEDWRRRIGALDLPACVIVGGGDASLGEAVQRTHTLPHLARGRLEVIDGGHALPLDNPQGLARVIRQFIEGIEAGADLAPTAIKEAT